MISYRQRDGLLAFSGSKKGFLAVLLALASILTVHPLRGEASLDPPVSRAEADLLSRVQDLAATDEAEAAAALQREITEVSSAALSFTLGNLYYAMEAWPRAVQAYETAIGQWPEYRAAVTNLAQVHLLTGEGGRAVEVLAAYLEQGRDRAPGLHLLLGQAHGTGEDWVPAESAFRQVLMLRPRDREARVGLTRALLGQERHKEAAALVAALLAEDPSQGEWWALRANLHLAENRQDQAITALESARLLGVATVEMLALLGDLYLNRGHAGEAARVYEQAHATDVLTGERMLRMAEGFLHQGESGEAARWMARAETAFEEGEGTVDLLRLRAEMARREGRMEEALGFYTELLAREPLNGRALLALADVQRVLRQPDEAALLCRRAARVEGYETRALTLLARIEVDRGRYTAAIQALEQALEQEDRRETRDYLDHIRRLAALHEGR